MKYIISVLIAGACCVGGWFFTRYYLKKNNSEFKSKKEAAVLISVSAVIFSAVSVLFPMLITPQDMSVIAIFRIMILIYALFFAAYIDFRIHLIPNKILLALLGAAVISFGIEAVMNLQLFRSEGIMALLGCAVSFVIFIVGRLISRNGMGMGDIKLASVIGLLLGLDSAIGCILWSLIIAAVTSVVLMIAKKANRKTRIPFAPFFFFGALVSHVIFIITGIVGG